MNFIAAYCNAYSIENKYKNKVCCRTYTIKTKTI